MRYLIFKIVLLLSLFSQAESPDYGKNFRPECKKVFFDNVMDFLMPRKETREYSTTYDTSIGNLIKMKPSSWTPVKFEKLKDLYDTDIKPVFKTSAVCYPEERESMVAQIKSRIWFLDEFARLQKERVSIRSGKERDFRGLVELTDRERRLLESASAVSYDFYHDSDHSIQKNRKRVGKLNFAAQQGELTCFQSKKKFLFRTSEETDGPNTFGTLAYCYATEVETRDYGVEGMGSDIQTHRTETGVLFWNLTAEGYQEYKHTGKLLNIGNLVLGVYEDRTKVPTP